MVERFQILVAFAMLGCGSCEPIQESVERTSQDPGPVVVPPTEEAAPRVVAPLGTIEGRVLLSGSGEPPRFLPTEIGSSVTSPEGCPPVEQRFPMPFQLGADRGLSGVMVTLTSDNAEDFFARVPTPQPQTHEIRISGCALRPLILGVAVHDRVRLINESDYPFMPQVGTVLQALMRDEPREMEIERIGPHAIVCSFAAGCGRSDVVAVPHRLFAVTTADGRFRIEGVPTDIPIRVHAYHPLLQEAVQPATFERGRASVDIAVEAREPPPPAPSSDVELI